jgi:hypothetical protein
MVYPYRGCDRARACNHSAGEPLPVKPHRIGTGSSKTWRSDENTTYRLSYSDIIMGAVHDNIATAGRFVLSTYRIFKTKFL